MDERIEKLEGAAAVRILRNVARKWIESPGVEAFVVIDQVRRSHHQNYDNPPQWLLDPPENASDELIAVSKLSLSAILDGEQARARDWVEDELAELKQARGQVLDPISLGIIGATIIGIVLASRVKKIGNVEFYEGVPKETVDIVKHASGIVVPKGS
jgi:hypothetical protein